MSDFKLILSIIVIPSVLIIGLVTIIMHYESKKECVIKKCDFECIKIKKK